MSLCALKRVWKLRKSCLCSYYIESVHSVTISWSRWSEPFSRHTLYNILSLLFYSIYSICQRICFHQRVLFLSFAHSPSVKRWQNRINQIKSKQNISHYIIKSTGEFTKRAREMSSGLFVCRGIEIQCIWSNIQPRRQPPNPFREFSCTTRL